MPPAWVRGRGLAVYQLVFHEGVAGGAIVRGAIAANADIRTALLAAGAAMVALPVLAVLAGLRLGTIQGLDLTPTPWPGDHVAGAVAPMTSRIPSAISRPTWRHRSPSTSDKSSGP